MGSSGVWSGVLVRWSGVIDPPDRTGPTNTRSGPESDRSPTGPSDQGKHQGETPRKDAP